MSTFYNRLRESAFDRSRGLEPGKVIVRRDDLVEILFHFNRLEQEYRRLRNSSEELADARDAIDHLKSQLEFLKVEYQAMQILLRQHENRTV